MRWLVWDVRERSPGPPPRVLSKLERVVGIGGLGRGVEFSRVWVQDHLLAAVEEEEGHASLGDPLHPTQVVGDDKTEDSVFVSEGEASPWILGTIMDVAVLVEWLQDSRLDHTLYQWFHIRTRHFGGG